MRPVKRALPRPQYMKYTLDKNISERNPQNASAIAYAGAKLKTVSVLLTFTINEDLFD